MNMVGVFFHKYLYCCVLLIRFNIFPVTEPVAPAPPVDQWPALTDLM